LVNGLVLVASLGLLGVAAWLEPSPDGMGTHQALGLPPCGFLLATGLPCATCGMTTAFAHAAHGQLGQSFAAQPAGALLAVLTAVLAILSAWALVAGRSLLPLWESLWRLPVVIAMAGVFLAAWLYKIALVQGML
jgi:hypothetical protein